MATTRLIPMHVSDLQTRPDHTGGSEPIGTGAGSPIYQRKYAFVVATHTDRAHVPNHIVFNSTSIDGSRKFRNFWLSSIALQRASDLV